MGNLIEALCIDCNENLEIDGFRCFHCGMDKNYLDMLDSELTLDWNN
jgi:hypothetical protein